MKNLIALALILICTKAYSQDWKEYCVLFNGDTLRVGDSIMINHVGSHKALDVIRAQKPAIKREYMNFAELNEIYWNIYNNAVVMLFNNTYEVARLSRTKTDEKDRKYKPLAIIVDTYVSSYEHVDYLIAIDSAIKNGTVTVLKK